MKKDIIVASSLFVIVLVACITIKSINNNSYAVNFEEDDINLIDSVNKLDEYVDEVESEEDTTMLETSYSIDEVYQSIYSLKDNEINKINSSMNDIYVNFYRYFGKENNFYNMYGEAYNYDEYMFIKRYHLMKDNEEVFGLYLTTYTKCEVYGLVQTDKVNSYLEEYCSNS